MRKSLDQNFDGRPDTVVHFDGESGDVGRVEEDTELVRVDAIDRLQLVFTIPRMLRQPFLFKGISPFGSLKGP